MYIGGELLPTRCMAESELTLTQPEGERARTVGQLRLSADAACDGGNLYAWIDPANRSASRPVCHQHMPAELLLDANRLGIARRTDRVLSTARDW